MKLECYTFVVKYLLAGFPSPWRWARRTYWRWVFEQLTGTQKYLAEIGNIDPESLIERGEL
jgi:hypothetical protein